MMKEMNVTTNSISPDILFTRIPAVKVYPAPVNQFHCGVKGSPLKVEKKTIEAAMVLKNSRRVAENEITQEYFSEMASESRKDISGKPTAASRHAVE